MQPVLVCVPIHSDASHYIPMCLYCDPEPARLTASTLNNLWCKTKINFMCKICFSSFLIIIFNMPMYLFAMGIDADSFWQMLIFSAVCGSGMRILLFFFYFSISTFIWKWGAEESHINLICPWIAASVWTDPELTRTHQPASSIWPQSPGHHRNTPIYPHMWTPEINTETLIILLTTVCWSWALRNIFYHCKHLLHTQTAALNPCQTAALHCIFSLLILKTLFFLFL